MDIRTFRASTLQEALEQVRETLGPDAAVLHTREVKRSRLGLFSSSLVEVDASIEMPVADRMTRSAAAKLKPAASTMTVHEPQPASIATEAVDEAAVPSLEVPLPVVPPTSAPKVTNIASKNKLDQRSTVASRASNRSAADGEPQSMSPAMLESLSQMVDAGVDATTASSLLQSASENLTLEQLDDAALIHGRIIHLVSKNLRVAEPIAIDKNEQTIIAMIGATGVGKTTTLAKLATRLQAEYECEVGLITLDTFRPGAVDQLLQYAETLNAVLEVVSSSSQFLPALNRLKACDVVLIDTAGRSPNDQEQIRVLQELLTAAKPTSVQLVVSATSSASHIKSTMQQFSPLQPTGLLVTKLDEANELGAWLTLLQHSDLPISYVTHGQHVREDIAPANRRSLASLLLGQAALEV